MDCEEGKGNGQWGGSFSSPHVYEYHATTLCCLFSFFGFDICFEILINLNSHHIRLEALLIK